MSLTSESPAPYLEGFRDSEETFLTYLRLAEDGRLEPTEYTRGVILQWACKAAHVLRAHGLQAGNAFVLALGGNQVGHLAFRLGAVMTGTVTVTISWQADSVDRILYKMGLTKARLVLIGHLVI